MKYFIKVSEVFSLKKTNCGHYLHYYISKLFKVLC